MKGRDPAASGVGLQVLLDGSEYVVNAMPPGPPALPRMRMRVMVARPDRLPSEAAGFIDVVVRHEGGAVVRRVVLEARNERGGLLTDQEVVVADDEGRPLPDGRYVVEVALPDLPQESSRAAFRVMSVH